MSTNVFALALLNGDLTLLSALHGTQPGRNCEGLQCFPLSKSIRNCSLDSQDPSDRISYQLDTHVLSEKGLGTEGNFWEMTEKIDLWSSVDALEFLESQWNRMMSMCLRAETSNGNMDATLREDIDELAIWAAWSVIRCLHANTKYPQLAMFQAKGSGIECLCISDRLCKYGFIFAGRLEDSDTDEPLTAVFDCDNTGYIFTPRSTSLTEPVKLGQEPVSFIVVKQESLAQQHVLCCERLVRGIWGDTTSSKPCCLAWNI
ncbi:uncharacterized protein EAE97_003696 [Botrytis byssoidea]|uniref:Heterokaryon incompatibility domain-containing protein n=1 Tax=Botrytis byssoidea TaxID=139641 RepID=A0A9P5M4E0_9HELO|nr:uncharacterized protein EAE97_003696 [Botrytis byssoidea]KAF7948285.1 hypothetical protein EAE97_003696 [Botrytis byssoidea]